MMKSFRLLLRKFISGAFNSAVLFVFFRNIINLGTLKGKILSLTRLSGKETILDVGCGAGEYSELTENEYLGIDHNLDYIRYAARVYGNRNKRFIQGDVTRLKVSKKYDLGLFISMMHHLNEKESIKVLSAMAKLTRKVLVIDLLDSANFIKHFLITLDRGSYVRPFEKQKELLQKVFVIEKTARISTRSGSADHSFFLCRSRKG